MQFKCRIFPRLYFSAPLPHHCHLIFGFVSYLQLHDMSPHLQNPWRTVVYVSMASVKASLISFSQKLHSCWLEQIYLSIPSRTAGHSLWHLSGMYLHITAVLFLFDLVNLVIEKLHSPFDLSWRITGLEGLWIPSFVEKNKTTLFRKHRWLTSFPLWRTLEKQIQERFGYKNKSSHLCSGKGVLAGILTQPLTVGRRYNTVNVFLA